MKNIRRFTLLSLVVFIGAWFFTCTMPTEMQLKGSPSYDLPAGRADYTLSELFDFNSLISDSLNKSIQIKIKQSDIISDSDFDLPTVPIENVPEPGNNASVAFVDSDSSDPFILDPFVIETDKYNEVSFSSGTLTFQINFDSISSGAEGHISNASLVDANFEEIAPANEQEVYFIEDGSNSASAIMTFDLTGRTLPNTFAFEMEIYFHNSTLTETFNVNLTPSIETYQVSEISGVEIDPPVNGSETVDDLQIDLPEYLSSATVEDGDLAITVSTPEEWAGFNIDLNAVLRDSGGTKLASDSDSGTDPELLLPINGVEFGGDPLVIEWNYTVDDDTDPATDTLFTFDDAGIANIEGEADLQINEMSFEVVGDATRTNKDGVEEDGTYWSGEDGTDALFEPDDDVFGRDEVDPDGDIEQILDGVVTAAIHFAEIKNETGLGIVIEIVDGEPDENGEYPFSKSLNLAKTEDEIALSEDDLNFLKNNLFTPAIKVFIPAGPVEITEGGPLTFTSWISLSTDIDYTIPLDGEEE